MASCFSLLTGAGLLVYSRSPPLFTSLIVACIFVCLFQNRLYYTNGCCLFVSFIYVALSCLFVPESLPLFRPLVTACFSCVLFVCSKGASTCLFVPHSSLLFAPLRVICLFESRLFCLHHRELFVCLSQNHLLEGIGDSGRSKISLTSIRSPGSQASTCLVFFVFLSLLSLLVSLLSSCPCFYLFCYRLGYFLYGFDMMVSDLLPLSS